MSVSVSHFALKLSYAFNFEDVFDNVSWKLQVTVKLLQVSDTS